MNPELQKALVEFLGLVRSGTDFAVAQMPLLVQELITYARVTLTTFTVALVVLSPLCYRLTRWMWKKANACWSGDDDGDWVLAAIVSFIAFVGTTIAAPIMAAQCAKAWLAPRVYVLDWIQGMLK